MRRVTKGLAHSWVTEVVLAWVTEVVFAMDHTNPQTDDRSAARTEAQRDPGKYYRPVPVPVPPPRGTGAGAGTGASAGASATRARVHHHKMRNWVE